MVFILLETANNLAVGKFRMGVMEEMKNDAIKTRLPSSPRPGITMRSIVGPDGVEYAGGEVVRGGSGIDHLLRGQV